MQNKSGDLYEHDFDAFHKIHSEEMKNVKKIFLNIKFLSELNAGCFGVLIIFQKYGLNARV